MKRRKFIQAGGIAATGMLIPVTAAGSFNGTLKSRGSIRTANPADNLSALVNPDMGWTMHFYSNVISNYGSKMEPSDTLDYFPGVSTVYLRVPWAFLELKEGKFNWELLDTALDRHRTEGGFQDIRPGKLDEVRHTRMGGKSRGKGI